MLTDDEAAPLSNQTFCDIYPTDTLAIGQRIKPEPDVPVLDLRGSPELYERAGDLTAFDLVNEHFRLLQAIVASRFAEGTILGRRGQSNRGS